MTSLAKKLAALENTPFAIASDQEVLPKLAKGSLLRKIAPGQALTFSKPAMAVCISGSLSMDEGAGSTTASHTPGQFFFLAPSATERTTVGCFGVRIKTAHQDMHLRAIAKTTVLVIPQEVIGATIGAMQGGQADASIESLVALANRV